jgi:hypothetical protein
MFCGVVIIVLAGVVTAVALVSVVLVVSVPVDFSLLSFPPHEAKNNTMAAQKSRLVNLDRFIDFDFND